MTRLYLFAEGQTELTFAASVLKPHLAGVGVYLAGPVLISHGRRGGKVHRGGGNNYAAMRNDILRFVKQEKGADVFFTTMIDLYALPSEFPGFEEANALRHLPEQRVQMLECAFAAEIGDHRFVPYIQLHEFEAYLFSEPSYFRFFYDDHPRQLASLQAIAGAYPTPELINDGPQTAPSKRITQLFPDYEGAKRVIGPRVAELIGLNAIRSKCPHFATWLTRLEGLG